MEYEKGWNPLTFVIWLIQAAAEGWLAFSIYRLNMLPANIFGIGAGVLVLLLLLTFAGMSVYGKKKKGLVRKCIMALLSLFIAFDCVWGAGAVGRLDKTVEHVTTTNKISSHVAVYVLTEDPAQTLEDAKDYSFAVTDSYDAVNSDKTVRAINDELGTDIQVKNYANALEMIDALREHQADAVILNEAYESVLDDLEEYSGFSDWSRILYEYTIEEEKAADTTEEVKQDKNLAKEPFLVYVSGSDTRNKMLTVSRSDVNILAAVNPETRQVLLLNTPRDYYIPNPAGGGALDKLTHCGIYGIDCSMKALTDLYGHEINYYGQINFTGFERLIDAIGGVTVFSEVGFSGGNGQVTIQQGYNDLNGAQALGFARERYKLPDGDNDRGRNQMKVIKAVIDKISAGALVSNYTEILDSLQGMFVTDMTSQDIAEFIKLQVSEGIQWDVHSYAVTGEGAKRTTYSMPNFNAYVMYPDQDMVDHASELITKVLDGGILTEEDMK